MQSLHTCFPPSSHSAHAIVHLERFATSSQIARLHCHKQSTIAFAQRPVHANEVPRLDSELDDELSRRPLELDSSGYFLIKLDRQAREIVAEYYTNIINKDGERPVAVDR
jgi:hypothetical protein